MVHPLQKTHFFSAGTRLWHAAWLLLLSLPAGAADPVPSPPPAPAQGTAPESVRVVYVPETVKAQIKEEVRQEVVAEAKKEGWGSGLVPEWLRRFHFYGDVRGRFERDLFGKGNANTGEFPDINAINTGTPFDANLVDTSTFRFLNVDQNRTRPRLRARLGVEVDITSGWSTGIRIGSGDGSTPVSLNQTLGGSGGNFSKYQIWLDQAWIRWDAIRDSDGALGFELGRFERPFFAMDFLWSDQVSYDGVALQASVLLGGGFRPFLVAGAFPVFTTAFAFAPDQTAKFPSLNKWLYAGQLGADWKLGEAVGLKFGAAFYYFWRTEGRLSEPCDTNIKTVSCNTDESRPSFAQKGNTYMAIRTPSAEALQAEATSILTPRYQYFGLASHYRELVGDIRLDLRVAPPLRVTLEAEAVRNFGFKPTEVSQVALNNRGPCDATGQNCPYVGGRDGYQGKVTIGSPTEIQQWDWSVSAAYRYLESDAVIDAFTDPDFGLGGTNLRGYVLSGEVFVARGVSLRVRWLSANSIVGPTYHADVVQVDLMARF